MSVAAELIQILNDLNVITNLLNNLQGLTGGANQLNTIQTGVSQLLTAAGFIENQNIQTQFQLLSLLAKVNQLETTLQAQIGNPQQTFQPVTLPTTPPPGYGGADPSDVASAVWLYSFPPNDFVAFTPMIGLWNFLQAIRDTSGIPLRFSERFLLQGNLFDQANYPWPSSPEINPASIVAADTDRLAWLNRVASAFTWNHDAITDTYWATFAVPNGGTIWCTLSEQEFLWFRAAAGGIVPGTNAAPVWPGLANVTLGTPVPFTSLPLTIPGPMHGIIVDITSVNQPLPHYWYGAAEAWGKLGGLTFTDDHGDAEEYQLFGFVHAVYSPRFMVEASTCEVRNISGIVGTVTPWTIT